MALVIGILAMIAGLAGLFLSGSTLNKLQTSNDKLKTDFRSEIKVIKNALENKLVDLEERLGNLERNLSPIAKTQTDSTTEIAAIRKQVVKLKDELTKLDHSIHPNVRIAEPGKSVV